MRKLELYRKAQTFGKNASFVANVILTGHSKPTTKLAGLVALLESGHDVSPAPYDIGRLWIDGRGGYAYSFLEHGMVPSDCACGGTGVVPSNVDPDGYEPCPNCPAGKALAELSL